MKDIRIKCTQGAYYTQLVPRREQHICSCEKDRLQTAIPVHGCNLHCDLHTVHR
jgi:hypothetical protein